MWRVGVLVVWSMTACDGQAPETDTDGSTDTETASDSGTETETDSETDSETDPEIDYDPAAFDVVIDVGPAYDIKEVHDVQWESLTPSTLVRIHHRDTPYRAKFVLAVAATRDAPLVVTGIASADGDLPVISGDRATTRLALDYWNEVRSVIKVGGSSKPSADP